MAEAPKRLQLRRTAGWRLPEGAVSVARPHRHGNPWAARKMPGGAWEVYDRTRQRRMCIKRTQKAALAQCIAYFRAACDPRQPQHWFLRASLDFKPTDLAQLRGRDLACWCKAGDPCHANILIELANAPLRCEPAKPD